MISSGIIRILWWKVQLLQGLIDGWFLDDGCLFLASRKGFSLAIVEFRSVLGTAGRIQKAPTRWFVAKDQLPDDGQTLQWCREANNGVAAPGFCPGFESTLGPSWRFHIELLLSGWTWPAIQISLDNPASPAVSKSFHFCWCHISEVDNHPPIFEGFLSGGTPKSFIFS